MKNIPYFAGVRIDVPCFWQAIGINKARKPYERPYYTNAHWPFVAKFPAN